MLSHVHEGDRSCNSACNVNLDRQYGESSPRLRWLVEVDRIGIGFGGGPDVSESLSNISCPGSGWGSAECGERDHYTSQEGTIIFFTTESQQVSTLQRNFGKLEAWRVYVVL
jgi:hypothetical protein